MLTAPRLDILRQEIVGNAIAKSLAAARPVPLTAATRARGEAVVEATVELRIFTNHLPVKVDRRTDSLVATFEHLVEAHERALCDDVVPLSPEQRESHGRARLVRTRVFPQGTGFIRLSMDLQWSELVGLRARMQEPEVVAALDGLGLRSAADHLLAHIDLYGRMVGQEGSKARAGQERACAAWTGAFRRLMAQALLDYENDTAMLKELLGPYEAQLAQQRAVMRAKKAKWAAGSGADAEEQAPPSA